MQQVAGGKARGTGAARSIVFIVADDLGFNDVSFHGSTQIPTPALDELAGTGLVLDNYHAQPVCSPTRASILSGRHAIHHGIYMPFGQGSALRLNLSYTLLPRYLQRHGYATHAVGKWHLGQNELAALPTVPLTLPLTLPLPLTRTRTLTLTLTLTHTLILPTDQ
jgi:arylsulfatase A-like enzyme